jgi:hypothetical protein
LRIRDGLSGSSGNVTLPEATPGKGSRRGSDATLSPPYEDDDGATAAASTPTSWRRRALLTVVLFTGVWACLAALAGAAGADDGQATEPVPPSASAPVDQSSDVPAADGGDEGPTPTAPVPPNSQDTPDGASDVPAPVAPETPPPAPQDAPAPVDAPATADPSELELTPAGTDALPTGTGVACQPTLDPTAAVAAAGTEQTAVPAGVPGGVPDRCGESDAPVLLVHDAAAAESSGTCEDSCAAPAALGSSAAPQPEDTRAVDPVASGVDELTPSAGRAATAATAATAGTPAPALPAPSPPVSPIQPPTAPPVAPPVPGHGTAGGCANSVSAGGHHGGSSTVAVVDLDTVASTPSGSGRFGSGCTGDVARRAIDPGSRPT